MIYACCFDIDKTIVMWAKSKKEHFYACYRAFVKACERVHKIRTDFRDFDWMGQTDYFGMLKYLTEFGKSKEEIETKKKLFFKTWQKEFSKITHLDPPYQILGKSREFIEKLHGLGMLMGILSGNLKTFADHKLAQLGLKKYFQFYSLGNLSPVRSDLFIHAKEKIEEKLQRTIRNRQVLVIGDTIHDIAVAKNHKTYSLAVATKPEETEDLRKAGADRVTLNFEDFEEVIEWIYLL